jgi:O-antigen/teichoic acid export membrane protein
MTGYNYLMMIISITSAVIALFASLMLAQRYGSTGVAVGYAIAMFTQQIAMLLFVRYRCGVWTHAGRLSLNSLTRANRPVTQ